MLGDTLSDSAADIRDAVQKHYRDEFNRLPVDLKNRVLAALEALDYARVGVDRFQVML